VTTAGRWLDEDAILAELDRDGVVLLQTDTLPGLHARIDRPAALQRLQRLKNRPPGKPLLVLAASCADALPLLGRDADGWLSYLRMCWPGPHTFILPASVHLPEAVRTPQETVAVRVPGRGSLRSLLARCGPLASTSANLAGQEPARDLAAAAEIFAELGAWRDDTEPGQDAASSLVDLTGDRPRRLRDGPQPLPAWDPEA
jgi:L-threonylcarbamoyladenylate synthase